MMFAAIHQPNVFPRLKVLQKLALADVWVVLDDVQFAQREYQNRAYIAPVLKNQPPRWCTIPVRLPHGRATSIQNVIVSDRAASATLRAAIEACFPSSQDLQHVLGSLASPRSDLVTLGVNTTIELLKRGDRIPEIVYASEMRGTPAPKTRGLIQLCRAVDASTYIADSGAAGYLEAPAFHEAGIDTLWHVWRAPTHGMNPDIARNGSALNYLARVPSAFAELLGVSNVSRLRDKALC